MKKIIFVLFLVSSLVLIGLSKMSFSAEPTESSIYKLYFEDDFSGPDKNWLITDCDTWWYGDYGEVEWYICGVDPETETYRLFSNDNGSRNIGFNLKYDKPEWGDKYEFDFTLAPVESNNSCGFLIQIADHNYENNETGSYHLKARNDRDANKGYLTLPNGTIISYEDREQYPLSIPTLSRLTLYKTEDCAIDFRIDNLKIHKQDDSNWGLIDTLIERVNILWEAVFGNNKSNKIFISKNF